MPKSVTLDQRPYSRTSRSNSPSASSVVTVRASGTSRSRSGSRKPSKTSASSDDLRSSKRPSSSSTRLSSSGSSKPSDKAAADGLGHYSRWSQSSNSTHGGNEHRRHSSFSKRFSFGPNPLAASQNFRSGRTPSPSKKRRPIDIQTGQAAVRGAKAGGNGDQLSIPSGLGTPKGLDSDGPRTPLLYMGQITSNNDMRTSPRGVGDPSSRTSPVSGTVESPLRREAQQESERGSTGSQKRGGSPSRTKSRRDRDKKTTLARALQRANDAVQLDNAQDYMGAVEAYEEACEYLRQVLNKTSGEEDKRKLSTIRTTYTTRINELQQLDSQWRMPEKTQASEEQAQVDATPEIRPSLDGTVEQPETPFVETATMRNVGDIGQSNEDRSMLDEHSLSRPLAYRRPLVSDLGSREISVGGDAIRSSSAPTDFTKLAPPLGSDMPPPLSPRRPPPPVPTESDDEPAPSESNDDYDPRRESHLIGAAASGHESWLETGQGSPGGWSQSSSHHSRSSVDGLRRKHLRTHSTSTEAEFDAALDAAVEAAYAEGYEPYVEADARHSRDFLARASIIEPQTRPDEYFAQRNSIIAAANARVALRNQSQHGREPSSTFSEPISELDSDDEERLLTEATQNFAIDDSTTDTRSTSNPPRQSDSSSSSGRTWGSSVASSLNTAGTSLTTVDEYAATTASKQLPAIPPPAPPPTGALPLIPNTGKPTPILPPKVTRNLPALAVPPSPSVQERRSSSSNGGKRLKIETASGPKPESKPGDRNDLTLSIPKRPQPEIPSVVLPQTAPAIPSSNNGLSPDTNPRGPSAPSSFRLISSPFPTPFQCQFPDDVSSSMSPPTPSFTPALTPAISNDSGSVRPSPQSASSINPFQTRPIDRGLLKSHSSLSLRQKGVLTPESYDTSPGTPMSFTFGAQTLNRPTGLGGGFIPPAPPVNNVNLFANEIHAPDTPSQSEARVPHPPRPLEPCPTSQLLRPFWLMRRFYQTVAHPRGGYLSTKVFIPRDVWKVKNVKLKNVDDKIANCDLLTAALLKLGAVDTLDADAVLEEMQAFESVLDQAQTNLSKKLGNDVGVQNVSALFKDAPATSPAPNTNDSRQVAAGDTTSAGASGIASKSNSKSYLSSWRKLRSKNSSAALSSSMPITREGSSKESLTMSSIPMTASWPGSSNRVAKKDGGLGGGDVKTDGPNASYMSALARLCDAVQVLDRIARQVEDPGLKHSSPTHVGLELSSRHAAEFFGFYICRFVLQDISMLAEKFVKRASEWVLS